MCKPRIVFIVGALSQPRCIKRIKAFYSKGYQCSVYGYNRGLYDMNQYPAEINVQVLCQIKNGKDYLGKFIQFCSDIKKIVELNNGVNVYFYAFGYVQALALKLFKVNYLYEISDIFYAYPKFKYFFHILKFVDKHIIKNSHKTIMTSKGFYNFFSLKYENIIVLPNKVDSNIERLCDRNVLTLQNSQYRFAFVGAIRYNSVLRFAETVGKFFPQHIFSFYGGCSGEMKRKVALLQSRYNNIKVYGPYRNPQDLPSIYSKIDVVVACYDVKSLNEKIAEPNKLYEALFFCKPIIVSSGTYLSERVHNLGCGFSLDANSEGSIKAFLKSLSPEQLNIISIREFRLASKEYVDNTENVVANLI